MRRTGDCTGVTVHFTDSMFIQSKKDEFLRNTVNKQRFIHYLSNKLETAGCSIDHVNADAVVSARSKNTVVVGDDTDLLIRLLKGIPMSCS